MEPTEEPTEAPTEEPTEQPSEGPTEEPTEQPTEEPSEEPTEQPSEQPTQQPTLVPTELCTSFVIEISNIGGSTDGMALTTYNGIYVKQASLVNEMDWWKHSTKSGDLGSSVYWSDSRKRWVIEASNVSWEAPTTTFNPLDSIGKHLIFNILQPRLKSEKYVFNSFRIHFELILSPCWTHFEPILKSI